MNQRQPVVRHRDDVKPVECPYGGVQRVVTGGEGGVANVHVVRVTAGSPHRHDGYDETYYCLSGTGMIDLAGSERPLKPGTVVVIPRGTVHSLRADDGDVLEFVIFGTPPMSVDDNRFLPRKPRS